MQKFDLDQISDNDILEGKMLLVDKPLQWTSFDVVKYIRKSLISKFKIKRIKAPPIQINNRSFWLTANISPNSNPITSNLIEDKKPITTRPTANDEWANKPNKASPGNLVVFCNLNNIIAITEETTNTEKAILMSKKTAIVTPSKAEWDNVSPKKDNLLQIMKQPMGPVTKAIPIPANNALIKKSSSII